MVKNNIMDFTEEQLDSIYDSIEKEFKDGKYNNVFIIGLGSTSLTNVSKSIIPMALSFAENEMPENYNDYTNKLYAFVGDSEHEIKENKIKSIAEALEEIDNAYVILLNTIESDEDDVETVIIDDAGEFKGLHYNKSINVVIKNGKNKINSINKVNELAITVSSLITDIIYVIENIDNKETNENIEKSKINDMSNKKIYATPKDIFNYLNKVMVGQEKAKKKVAIATYEHLQRVNNKATLIKDNKELPKGNIMLVGSTGSGKTFMCKKLAEYLGVPMYIQDISAITANGYIGGDVQDCIKGLINEANGNIELAQHGIIVLDEFDKIRATPSERDRKDVNGASVQHSLLKYLEGAKVTVNIGTSLSKEDVEFDTSNVLFIGIGSYDGIDKIVESRLNKGKSTDKVVGFGRETDRKETFTYSQLRSKVTKEDLKQYGIISEVLGRFATIAVLDTLKKEDLVNILKLKNGIINAYKTEFELENKKLVVDDNIYSYIAEKAIKEKTGARGIDTIVKEIMEDLIFEMPSNKKKTYKLNIKK